MRCCCQIERFKGVGTAKRADEHVENRKHLICTDVSKGREATPSVAVNEVGRCCSCSCRKLPSAAAAAALAGPQPATA